VINYYITSFFMNSVHVCMLCMFVHGIMLNGEVPMEIRAVDVDVCKFNGVTDLKHAIPTCVTVPHLGVQC